VVSGSGNKSEVDCCQAAVDALASEGVLALKVEATERLAGVTQATPSSRDFMQYVKPYPARLTVVGPLSSPRGPRKVAPTAK
jgi:hypothetical protein